MTMTYQVLRDDDRPVLCVQYHFKTIGTFQYVELFLSQVLPVPICSYASAYMQQFFVSACAQGRRLTGKACVYIGITSDDRAKKKPGFSWSKNRADKEIFSCRIGWHIRHFLQHTNTGLVFGNRLKQVESGSHEKAL